MADEKKVTSGDKTKTLQKIADDIGAVINGKNVQTYIFGTKKNGTPRALYDIYKDHAFGKGAKKCKKGKGGKFSLYFGPTEVSKKKKKKNKKKHWRLYD